MADTEDPKLQYKIVKGKTSRPLRVGCADYKIVYCKDLMLGEHACHGVCDPEARVIYLDVDGKQVMQTLLHEIVHAAVSEFGIRQHEDWCVKLEELIAETVSRVLVANFHLRAVAEP